MLHLTCVQTAGSICSVNSINSARAAFTNEGLNPLFSLFPFLSLCRFVLLSVYYPVCLLPYICLTAPNDPSQFPAFLCLICIFLLFSVSVCFVPHLLGHIMFSPLQLNDFMLAPIRDYSKNTLILRSST